MTPPASSLELRPRQWCWTAALLLPVLLAPAWFRLFASPAVLGTFTGLVLTLLLACCAWTDVTRWKVPNWATYTALLYALLINLLAAVGPPGTAATLGACGLGASFAGAVLVFVPLFVLFAAKTIGAGDVKLAAAIAALLGPEAGCQALVWSFVLAGAVTVLTLVVRLTAQFRHPRGLGLLDRRVPLALYFAAGAWLSLLYERSIFDVLS